MKRGLVPTAVSEETRADCAARVERLRSHLLEAGCDAALIYGDVSRAEDIYYLGNLCLFWNEGVLVVPARGEAAFATKLSQRSQPWMRAAGTIDAVRSGPNLPRLIGQVLADAGTPARRVGLVDRDWWPCAVLDTLDESLPETEFVDLGDVVRRDRVVPDERELEALRRLGRVAAEATNAAVGLEGTPGERIAAIERIARPAGMTDVFATAESAADRSVTVTATLQLQHLWLRVGRSIGGPLADHAAAESARVASALRDGASDATLAAALSADAPGDVTLSAEAVRHVDVAAADRSERTNGDASLRRDEVVVVTVTAAQDGGRASHTDTYLVREHSAELLSGVA